MTPLLCGKRHGWRRLAYRQQLSPPGTQSLSTTTLKLTSEECPDHGGETPKLTNHLAKAHHQWALQWGQDCCSQLDQISALVSLR